MKRWLYITQAERVAEVERECERLRADLKSIEPESHPSGCKCWCCDTVAGDL